MSEAETQRLIAQIHSVSAEKVAKGNEAARMHKMVRLSDLLDRLRELHQEVAKEFNNELSPAGKREWNEARKKVNNHKSLKRSPKKTSLCKRVTNKGCSIQGGRRTRKSRK